jgi:hypothetical protein
MIPDDRIKSPDDKSISPEHKIIFPASVLQINVSVFAKCVCF